LNAPIMSAVNDLPDDGKFRMRVRMIQLNLR
jgi:hypothetical protein